jgi:hypothetical protein
MSALALLLAACTPPAPQASAPDDAAAPASANAAQLSIAPLPGQWFFNGDGATVSTAFGPPESEGVFAVVCNGGTTRVTLMSSHELVPDQATTLRIITATQTLDFPARSLNQGLPTVNAELDGADPRLAALAATQERFAVEVAGESYVLPWDQSIARTLSNCAG